MLLKNILALLGLSFTGVTASAQDAAYPKDYFRNPLDIPIMLAGNFGECRPNHFHSGIDIKTNGKENLPVYAAADGYIARIKMEPGGFGHALYIAHPNGYTTLYAHLNDFMPAVQKYVRAEQYKKESWMQDIALTPSQFPVKKGQQIAWSGNTGGSTAPHLHFEIRSSRTEHPLNPLLFGLPVVDSIAPKPVEVALYDLSKSIYEQTPRIYKLRKKGENHYVADTLFVGQQTGVGINTDDFMNGSSNTLTYYTAKLSLDGKPEVTIRLDDIGYDVTRYMHAFIDYKTKQQKGKWLQCLFQLEGNRLDNIYEYESEKINRGVETILGIHKTKGVLTIDSGETKKVEIELTDALGNTSDVSFYIVHKKTNDSTGNCKTGNYFSVRRPNSFSNNNVSFALDEKALYAPFCFEYKKLASASGISDRHSIHKPYVPLHSWFDLKIKPDNPAALNNSKSKVAMVYNDGKEDAGKAAKYVDGWYIASVRNFGEYRLVVDKEPPVITSLQKEGANLAKAKRISFTAEDEITSVRKFRGELDGKWICMEQHEDNFFYMFDEHCPPGKHTLVFTASDENGNTKTLRYTFTR